MSVLTFLLIHLIPGDLVTILLGITASQNEQTRQALIHALHLDRPLAVQYLLWLGEVLRGDLGHSLVTGFSVRDELARSYPVTLQLALMAMSIALPSASRWASSRPPRPGAPSTPPRGSSPCSSSRRPRSSSGRS